MRNGRLAPLGLLVLVISAWTPGFTLGQGNEGPRLSLDECRRMALENNLDLVSAKQDPAIAAQRIEVNRAPFDGVLGADGNFNRSEQDQTITTIQEDPVLGLIINTGPAETDTDNWSATASFRHQLQYGGSYTVSYEHSEIDSAGTEIQRGTNFLTDSVFVRSLDGITLNYTMPLLQGFGREVNTEGLLLARGNLDISREDLRLAAIGTVQSVEDAYWDVLAAREALRISRLALERAEDLLELNRKKVEVGTLAPIEITEAEAGVAAQVEAVIVAENDVENAEDNLLQLLAVPEGSAMWEQSLVLTDRPSFVPVDVDVSDAIAVALEERPEMQAARQRLRNNELSERAAKRRVRHSLDLTADLSPIRDVDTEQRTNFPLQPELGLSEANTISETTDWTVALRYSFPVRNREAKANYAIASLQKRKSDLDLQSTEQTVRVSVRTAARNLTSAMQRVEAARKNVVLQQKKLEAEEKKFENGMSTSFEVLTFQNDLADAELAEIRARLAYVKALTELERSKGTLLEARGMALAP